MKIDETTEITEVTQDQIFKYLGMDEREVTQDTQLKMKIKLNTAGVLEIYCRSGSAIFF